VFVPDWAMAITENDLQQKVLGFIDYWLGLMRDIKGRIRVRASGKYLYVDEHGEIWYAATYRTIGMWLHKDKEQVRWAVRQLTLSPEQRAAKKRNQSPVSAKKQKAKARPVAPKATTSKKDGFLISERHDRRKLPNVCRFRLNWKKIEEAFAKELGEVDD